jgi:hypothetical protein
MPYPQEVLRHYSALADPNITLHREVLNVISSYNNPWDPIAELIQNAVDAINERANIEEAAYVGKLLIQIDSTKSTVLVEDNGIGIPPGKLQDLLIPGGTLKTAGNSYGHKGLGFTYCAHICSQIVVDTRYAPTNDTDRWCLENAFDWIGDPADQPTILKEMESIRTLDGPGTSILMTLCPGRYETTNANTSALEVFFKWADEKKILEFVLRTRTAIGHVGSLFGKVPSPNISIEVEIVNSGENFGVPYSYFDLASLAPMNAQPHNEAQKYFSNIYDDNTVTNKSHHGIYYVFDKDLDDEHQTLKVGKHKGGIQFSVFVYACGKSNLKSALEQWDPRLRRNDEFGFLAIDAEVYLAIDGMPCGNPIDTWSEFGGFYDRFFAIINADLIFGTVLDAGRKTITPHYVKLFLDKIDALMRDKRFFNSTSSLYEMAQQLNVQTSGPSTVGKPKEYVDKWDNLPTLTSLSTLIGVEPNDELATYLIFGELVGLGFLSGYAFRYVSGAAIYDGALSCTLLLDNEKHINESAGGSNPVGVGATLVQQAQRDNKYPDWTWADTTHGIDYLVTEFKVQASQLMSEVHRRRSQKQFNEIDLLICWEVDTASLQANYQAAVTAVTNSGREIPGHTHKISTAGQSFNVIELKSVLDMLSSD